MKKSIVAFGVFFALQILGVLYFVFPKTEPVVWAQNTYGEYEMASCIYGDAVLQEIQKTVSDFETAQLKKYLIDSTRQVVLTRPSRVLCNTNGVTVVEYQTQRRTYTAVDDGVFTGNELLETAQLWITETSSGAAVEIRQGDCAACAFTNEKVIAYESEK